MKKTTFCPADGRIGGKGTHMQDSIRIPVAFCLRADDVGWHNGDDDRYFSRPSRTGIPRKHVPADYRALHELGKALNMKISCSLVLAEWDKDNLLRGVPHVTWDPEGWDRASEIDMDYAKACFEALDGSEYLDYTLHGLMHGYYDSGMLVTEEQYYPKVYDAAKGGYTKAWRRLSDAEFRRHLDLFFEIYRSWGFSKPVRSFAAPNGSRGTPAENAGYADILREYGLLYWRNGWRDFDGSTDVTRGVICSKGFMVMEWNVFDADPALLPLRDVPSADFCFHWPNFLRWNPEHNPERIPAWADYFRREAELWGVMMGRDVPFADSQTVYSKFAEIREENGQTVIDLAKVDALGALGLQNEFYVSVRNGQEPAAVSGGTLALYETKREFRTYQITRDGAAQVVLTLRGHQA